MRTSNSRAGTHVSGLSFLSDRMRGGSRMTLIFALVFLMVVFVLHSSRSYHGATSRSTVQISQLLQSGITLLNAAGVTVVKYRDANDQGKQVKGLTKEDKKEFVTIADVKSHTIIKGGLLSVYPHLNIISEEHDPVGTTGKDHQVYPDQQLNAEILDATVASSDTKYDVSDVVVWIDPLDATQEYTEMLDQYVTIMMCIVVRGEPLASVIHFPFSKETYWQWSGHRASSSLETLLKGRTDSKGDIHQVVVSRSHAGAVNATLLSIDKDLRVVPAGGAGYKVFALINQKADAYVHTTAIKKWDICVGDAMLRHTGGELRSLKSGRRLTYGDPAKFKVEGGFLAVGKKGAGDTLVQSLMSSLHKQ